MRLARNSTAVRHELDSVKPMKEPRILPARTPTIAEIDALESALELSDVSLPEPGKALLKYAFLSEQSLLNSDLANGRYHSKLWENDPLITYEAKPGSDFESIKRTHMHEIVHHSQDRLWDTSIIADNQLRSEMGWGFGAVRQKDGTIAPANRILSADGSTGFCHTAANSTLDNRNWLECPDWQNKSLSAQLPENPARFTADEVRAKTRVKPATTYFEKDVEMHAEAVVEFRLGGTNRARLLQDSQTMYQIAKLHDQADIDLRYPPRDGQSQFIRLPNSRLSPNTEEARRIVAEFEQRLKANSGTLPVVEP